MSTYYIDVLKFPDIQQPSFPIEISYENVVLRSRKENGDYKSRKKFSYARKTFNLKWNAMSWKDYQILENFYINDCKTNVETFVWNYPVVSSKYQMSSSIFHNKAFLVRFASISVRATEHNSLSVSVVLTQATNPDNVVNFADPDNPDHAINSDNAIAIVVPGFAKTGNSLVMTGADLDVLNVALGTTPLTLEGSMWLQFP